MKEIDSERYLKILRLSCIVYGSFLLIFETVTYIDKYIWMKSHPYLSDDFLIMMNNLSLFLIYIPGILLILTYFGLKYGMKFARFTGIIGSGILIILSKYTWSHIYLFSLFFWIPFLLFVIPPVWIFISILYLWGKIPSHNKFQLTQKTKRTITVVILGIVVTIVLFVAIPEIQKHYMLDPLKYADYKNGWGFNPPDGWEVDDRFYPTIVASPTGNDSSYVELYIEVGIITSSSDIDKIIDEIAQSEMESFKNEWWLNTTANFSLISYGKKTINGMDSFEIIFSYRDIYENGTIGPEKTYRRIFLLKGSRVLLLDYVGLSDYYNKYESVVNQSINSFTIV